MKRKDNGSVPETDGCFCNSFSLIEDRSTASINGRSSTGREVKPNEIDALLANEMN
jgi:hypothetical protein